MKTHFRFYRCGMIHTCLIILDLCQRVMSWLMGAPASCRRADEFCSPDQGTWGRGLLVGFPM